MKTKTFIMRADPDWISRIDAWRFAEMARVRRDIPRAEAVRVLVDRGLARSGRKPRTKTKAKRA